MVTGGIPSKETVKQIEYERKAAAAWARGYKIREWIYGRIAKHYERKHDKKFMSR